MKKNSIVYGKIIPQKRQYLNSDLSPQSKTDSKRQWGKPAQRNKYKKAAKASKMFGTGRAINITEKKTVPYELKFI